MAAIRYFCFRLGGHTLAIPVAGIAEVIPQVLHEVLPEQPEGVMGMINYHGQPLVLLDTAILLGARYRATDRSQNEGGGRENYIAIMETPQGLIGLLLDGLEGVQNLSIDATGIERVLPKDYPVRPRLVSGVAYHDGRPVFALDPALVFSTDQMQALGKAFLEQTEGEAPAPA